MVVARFVQVVVVDQFLRYDGDLRVRASRTRSTSSRSTLRPANQSLGASFTLPLSAALLLDFCLGLSASCGSGCRVRDMKMAAMATMCGACTRLMSVLKLSLIISLGVRFAGGIGYQPACWTAVSIAMVSMYLRESAGSLAVLLGKGMVRVENRNPPMEGLQHVKFKLGQVCRVVGELDGGVAF